MAIDRSRLTTVALGALVVLAGVAWLVTRPADEAVHANNLVRFQDPPLQGGFVHGGHHPATVTYPWLSHSGAC